MIANLEDKLYQFENKQAKGAKLSAKIMQELQGKRLQKFLQGT